MIPEVVQLLIVPLFVPASKPAFVAVSSIFATTFKFDITPLFVPNRPEIPVDWKSSPAVIV